MGLSFSNAFEHLGSLPYVCSPKKNAGRSGIRVWYPRAPESTTLPLTYPGPIRHLIFACKNRKKIHKKLLRRTNWQNIATTGVEARGLEWPENIVNMQHDSLQTHGAKKRQVKVGLMWDQFLRRWPLANPTVDQSSNALDN